MAARWFATVLVSDTGRMSIKPQIQNDQMGAQVRGDRRVFCGG